MPPLVRAGAVAALLTAVGAALYVEPRHVRVGSALAPGASALHDTAPSARAPCPHGTLPDHEVCIPAVAPSACLTPRACSQSRRP